MTPASREPADVPTPAIICEQFEMGDAARALLEPDHGADDFLSELVENRLFTDAIRFTAFRLPKREAVWWGCLCAWEVSRPKPSQVALAALQACGAWVKEPNEPTRRAVGAAADAALGTPAGFLAMAAFLSGGSMSAPKLPAVAPGPRLTARLVSEAVLLASRAGTSDEIAARQRRFLAIASDVVTGKVPVPETKPLVGKPVK